MKKTFFAILVIITVLLISGCNPEETPAPQPTQPVGSNQPAPVTPANPPPVSPDPTPPPEPPVQPLPPPASAEEGLNVGNLAPAFTGKTLDGQNKGLADYRGKPVLLNFWATWCGPCRSEMPHIQAVHEQYNADLVVLGVNVGESASEVSTFMQEQNLDFDMLLDADSNISDKYGIRGIPATFFLDKDGIIRDKVVGSFPNKAAIENRLKTILP